MMFKIKIIILIIVKIQQINNKKSQLWVKEYGLLYKFLKVKKILKKEEEFGRYHDKKCENITNGINEENTIEYDNNVLNIKDKDE